MRKVRQATGVLLHPDVKKAHGFLQPGLLLDIGLHVPKGTGLTDGLLFRFLHVHRIVILGCIIGKVLGTVKGRCVAPHSRMIWTPRGRA